MRLRLDPFSPSGVSTVVERPMVNRQSNGYVSNKATGLITAGTNVTLTGNGTDSSPYVISSSGGGGGTGITRTVASISSPTTAGATATTDYVFFVSGTTTLTLPTAVGNTNRYTVKNTGVATVTIATTSAQTIDGSSTITLPVQYTSVDLISDGTNWNVV